MLTTRSVIITILAVAILSVIGSLVSLLRSGTTHSTLGKDFYGTRTEGYRATHDLLADLGFETQRVLIPDVPENALTDSYILWNPRNHVVQTEPAYLNLISQWVREGGYLVVTPSVKTDEDQDNESRRSAARNHTGIPISLFKELGLEGVTIKDVSPANETTAESGEEHVPSENPANQESDSISEAVRDVFRVKERPSAVYSIASAGEWDHLNTQATKVELPSDQGWSIDHGDLKPLARITIDDSTGDSPNTLAALFSLGKGRVAVISNPYLASNANLSAADNSVLLAHLLTNGRARVIFDEFYHGLTVRGNALWLLSKPPYAVMTVSILAVAGVWVWRQAIFLGPSRIEQTTSRRTLNEYLDAMSRFLLKSRSSPKFVLGEVRNGVLWHFCKSLGLPPQQHNVDKVLGLLARRTPQKATQLETALKFADTVLNNPRAPKQEIILATRKVSDCLST